MQGHERPHAVAIPLPAQGHLNPLMRFCKTLASKGFTITFVNIHPIHQRILQCRSTAAASSSRRRRSSENDGGQRSGEGDGGQRSEEGDANSALMDIRRVSIPIDGLDLANDFQLSFADFLTATQALSDPIERLLERLSQEGPPVTCLISDAFMSGPTQGVADKLGIPRVSLFPSSQCFNLFFFYIRTGLLPLQDVIRSSIHNKPAEMSSLAQRLPGLLPLRTRDMPTFKHIVEETPRLAALMARQCQITYESAHAIVVNSFHELEAPAFDAMAKQLPQPIYGVGPLVEHLEGESSTSLWREEDHCLLWLDQQPLQSVLYISFGSITLLSKQQFEEVIAGLEASGQRFLWAFRPDLLQDGSGFPPGFMESTRNRSCIVTWVPQLRVLCHPSVGGFLTHCGWNSTTEAISAGVPMLCWPYLCDQYPNAKYIVEEWQVGLRFEAGSDGGLVGRSEVERVVRALMEGEEGKTLRKKASQLSEAARRSLQAGGSSHQDMESFVHAFSRRRRG